MHGDLTAKMYILCQFQHPLFDPSEMLLLCVLLLLLLLLLLMLLLALLLLLFLLLLLQLQQPLLGATAKANGGGRGCGAFNSASMHQYQRPTRTVSNGKRI